jgi:Putative Actinobacterial Holin-X, holin superfamily III
MEDGAEQSTAKAAEKPGMTTLVRQLGEDARSFAEAEARYLKAAAGERVSYGTPGVAMLLAAASLAAGALVALLFGLMIMLTPYFGAMAATAVVFTGSLIISGLLGWAGTNRLRNALKRPEDR